ncbi:MAG: hypothetical protein ACO1SV_17055 [Fimbriimonas sp.]
MKKLVDGRLICEIGEGKALRVLVAPQGGWWIMLIEADALTARVRVKPDDLRRITRGKVLTEGEVELRGMRSEVEFRVQGRILGRVDKGVFTGLVQEAEKTRPPQLF